MRIVAWYPAMPDTGEPARYVADLETIGDGLVASEWPMTPTITVTRGFSLAFFDHTLRDAPPDVFGQVKAPTDVQVFVYPLIRRGS